MLHVYISDEAALEKSRTQGAKNKHQNPNMLQRVKDFAAAHPVATATGAGLAAAGVGLGAHHLMQKMGGKGSSPKDIVNKMHSVVGGKPNNSMDPKIADKMKNIVSKHKETMSNLKHSGGDVLFASKNAMNKMGNLSKEAFKNFKH